jgi:Spy/CpxP family protein refolding chaperone
MKSMTVLIRAAALFGVLLLVSVPAVAQGKWWTSDVFKRELGLTTVQTERLEDIFQKAMAGLKAKSAKLEDAEKEFQRLITAGDAAAMEQINIVETARFELNKTRALMLWNMRQVLTTDQYVKVTALQQAQAAERAAKPKPTPPPAAR